MGLFDNRAFRLYPDQRWSGIGFSAERDNAAQSNFTENRLISRQEVAQLEILVMPAELPFAQTWKVGRLQRQTCRCCSNVFDRMRSFRILQFVHVLQELQSFLVAVIAKACVIAPLAMPLVPIYFRVIVGIHQPSCFLANVHA